MAARCEHQSDRDELYDLYRLAIEEYHFDVRLSWDRSRIFVGLNAVLVTAASAVMRFIDGPALLLVPIPIIGVVVCALGIRTARNGHSYYRRAIYKKTLIEDRLGLTNPLPAYEFSGATLSTTSTPNRADYQGILDNSEDWLGRRIRLLSNTGRVILLPGLLGLAYLSAFAGSLFLACTE